jgi:hypothetical protein
LSNSREGERNILLKIKNTEGSTRLVTSCVVNAFGNLNIYGKIDGTKRGRKRLKQLLDNLKEKKVYWKLKKKTVDRTLWRILFGRGYGLVAGRTKQ